MPLRARADDIPLLVEGLLARINRELHKQVRAIAPETMAALVGYAWPGNVRELENALTRAVVLSAGEVLEARHLPMLGPPVAAAAAAPALVSLREVERRQHVEPVGAGQPQVEQHHLHRRHRRQRGGAVARRRHVVALAAQELLQAAPDRSVVVDHQDAGHDRCSSATAVPTGKCAIRLQVVTATA